MAVRFKNKQSGLYAGIREASTEPGPQLLQWHRADDGSQVFEVISQRTPQNRDNDYYVIQNVHSGLYVGVREASRDNGKDLLQWTSANDGSQYWRFISKGNGTTMIQNAHISGKVWAILNASTSPGELIIQWDFIGNSDQLWYIEQA
ncbi:RICIN domain-containing protein [Phormidesmis sp. 146-33]